MFAACQRLRRRALVVLAWLVLALSVAPVLGDFEPVRPVAAFVSAASRASVGRRGLARVQRVSGVASPRLLSSAQPPSAALSFPRHRSAARADTSPWPAPDERWLYLKNNALLC
jgi:hypothetical protein